MKKIVFKNDVWQPLVIAEEIREESLKREQLHKDQEDKCGMKSLFG